MTTISVLLGSSVIGGALGFFMQGVTGSSQAWFEEEVKQGKLAARLKTASRWQRRCIL
jgi:hypothetical protein